MLETMRVVGSLVAAVILVFLCVGFVAWVYDRNDSRIVLAGAIMLAVVTFVVGFSALVHYGIGF